MDTIQACIAPGSIIISDMWTSYQGIETTIGLNYTHETVNHTENLLDPTNGAHTQTIESLWHVYKIQNQRQCGAHRSLVDNYLYAGTDQSRSSKSDHNAIPTNAREETIKNTRLRNNQSPQRNADHNTTKITNGPIGSRKTLSLKGQKLSKHVQGFDVFTLQVEKELFENDYTYLKHHRTSKSVRKGCKSENLIVTTTTSFVSCRWIDGPFLQGIVGTTILGEPTDPIRTVDDPVDLNTSEYTQFAAWY
ncbi:hypothetical protein CLF_100532 [Clonorchis sinensis]|uniref:ISXO2-like transposase domain-containing protein n=1 Tax=Clonorchis sinensis TaxID=79923 RepID=G7Y3N7_CLOSI|nr:hypothetical protein CLF_100532 [Clonorchis sinensis]